MAQAASGIARYDLGPKDNPLAAIGAFVGEPDRRLDSILVRSPLWRPKRIDIVGNRSAGCGTLTLVDRTRIEMPDRRSATGPVDIEVFPSDHYGLEATLMFKP